ncbi:uncharacterized protein A4U43_C04F32360 [Asparagus officinalis]|uniref:Uncharacterized protein n=1 Tax=Asparagus officinalis TaxID=4686 RepID=A0A5P1F558_ASPOF|nr:uncharacterized protein LOC109836172 [Asparagus officinalis]ONK73508.1 uncharacterized protein A4U43_C04F32360 [Asparagus officinalis]
MGMHVSSMRRLGVKGKQTCSSDEIFNNFFGPEVCTFEEFHASFLNLINKFNAALPGRRYSVPPLESIMEFYQNLENYGEDAEEKKYLVIHFLERNISINQTHNNAVMWTGLVAPTAALILKKAVPDVIFVPFCTMLAVAAAKAMHSQKI